MQLWWCFSSIKLKLEKLKTIIPNVIAIKILLYDLSLTLFLGLGHQNLFVVKLILARRCNGSARLAAILFVINALIILVLIENMIAY